MVLAAGLGTRLRPLTYELPKPMVPVVDRPVMAHIVDLLKSQGVTDVIANLHYFPDTIRDYYFGDEITYRYEPELLGTAGGVRNCRDFFGDEPFLVISGDALTDLDITALRATHDRLGGVATLTVKQVPDTREFGVVIHDENDRILGFQEKPAPEEAKSDLGNCGIYLFSPKIFDYFPEADPVDWRSTSSRRCSRTTSRSTSTVRTTSTGTMSLARRAQGRHVRRAHRRARAARHRGRRRGGRDRRRGVEHRRRRGRQGPGVHRLRRDDRQRRAADGSGRDRRPRSDRRGRDDPDSIVLPGTVVEPGSIVIGATLAGPASSRR